MAVIIKPPDKCCYSKPSVFLAGTIDMGESENWQQNLEQELAAFDIIILNPRRSDWNPQCQKDIPNIPFREQVNWELEALEKSDLIFMHFLPNSKSPISLLALGNYAKSANLLVCCPQGFWRKADIEILCEQFNIPLFENLENAIKEFKKKTTIMVNQMQLIDDRE